MFIDKDSRLTSEPTRFAVGANDTKFEVERTLGVYGMTYCGFHSSDIVTVHPLCPILVFPAEGPRRQIVKFLLRGRPGNRVGQEVSFKRTDVGGFLGQLETLAHSTQVRFYPVPFVTQSRGSFRYRGRLHCR